MKKNTRLSLMMALLIGVSGVEAQSVAHYFVEMPAQLLPTVQTDTRKDLVDFFRNGKSAIMPAVFGGTVTLMEMSEDCLLLQTSGSAEMQLKVLQVNDTLRILAVVQTVAAPLKHSTIQFFSTEWQPLTDLVFPKPDYLHFLDLEKGRALGLTDRFHDVSLRNFIYFRFRPNSPQIVAYSSIREDIRPEILPDFEPILKDSLTYDWNKGSFVPHELNQ